MSINLNDNFNVSAPLPIDSRYGNGAIPFSSYASVSAANVATEDKRYIGLTVLIGTPAVEYWYRNGITDLDLVPKYYSVSSSGGSIEYYFNDTGNTTYSKFQSNENYSLLDSGNLPTSPVGTATGVKSQAIIKKASSSLWTNDYSSNAYEAQSRYLTSHPWVSIPSGDVHEFQVYDSLVRTSKDTSIFAKYFDERIDNRYWQETYNNKSTLTVGATYVLKYFVAGDNFSGMTVTTISGTINTSGWTFTYTSGTPTAWTNGSILIDSGSNRLSGSTQLVSGRVYTLTTLAGGDVFNNGIGTTYTGTTGSPTSPPWTFTSNGAQPTTWTNGSIIEADFPYIQEDQKASTLTCEVASSGLFSGKGIINAKTSSLNCSGMFNQSTSTRGTVLAHRTTTQRNAISSPVTGEMIYNTTTNKINFYDGSSWVAL